MVTNDHDNRHSNRKAPFVCSLVYACRYRFYYNTRSKVRARYYTRSGRPCWQCYCSKLRLVGTMDLHELIPDIWLDFDELNELFDNQPTGAALSEKDDMLASQQLLMKQFCLFS